MFERNHIYTQTNGKRIYGLIRMDEGEDDWKNGLLLFNYSIKLYQALWLCNLHHMMENSK